MAQKHPLSLQGEDALGGQVAGPVAVAADAGNGELPLLAGNVFQQLYNMVDSIVVGNYVGSSALTAVGTGFPGVHHPEVLQQIAKGLMGVAEQEGVHPLGPGGGNGPAHAGLDPVGVPVAQKHPLITWAPPPSPPWAPGSRWSF